MERFYRFSLRSLLRDVPLALLLGAGIGVVLWVGDSQKDNWWVVAIAAWVGLWIYGVVTGFLAVFSRVLARLAGWRLYALGSRRRTDRRSTWPVTSTTYRHAATARWGWWPRTFRARGWPPAW